MFVKSASIRYSSFLGAFYISSFYHFLAFISALIPKIVNISSMFAAVGIILLIVLGMFKKKENTSEKFFSKEYKCRDCCS